MNKKEFEHKVAHALGQPGSDRYPVLIGVALEILFDHLNPDFVDEFLKENSELMDNLGGKNERKTNTVPGSGKSD